MDTQKPAHGGSGSAQVQGFVFPAWTNKIAAAALTGLMVLGGVATFVVWYYFSPKHTDVGYQPTQPVPYSHKLHAGDMGMDCRYCHTAVEKGPHATVPPTQTCMNCHSTIKKDSPKLEALRESWAKDTPVEWVKIHKTPDYAYFDHSRHVKKGVGCVECHGRVDQMEVVRQVQPLSMGWCLDCHRDPAKALRPADVPVTKMDWKPTEDRAALGRELIKQNNIHPPTDCSGCHR